MISTTPPTKIQLPFANGGTKNIIPVPSQIGVTPGRASFTDGFPPLTTTPLAAGGVPPYGSDFNGILNAITDILRWVSSGGLFAYDSAFATAIGGYPKGAVLESTPAGSQWLNLTEGNTSNPDTGGAGWQSNAPAIGNGQTWQNLTASRAVATAYVNNTGRAISVSVGMTSNAANATATISVNGVQIGGSSNAVAGGPQAAVSAIIPPGATYSASMNIGTSTLIGWAELR